MAHEDFEPVGTNFKSTADVPRGEDLCYRCDLCNDVVSSATISNAACPCRNIRIDAEYNRLTVRDLAKFSVLRRAPETGNRNAELIAEMQRALSQASVGQAALVRLTERLLQLRDALSLDDPVWFHALTHEIVTLDSAATYEPKSSAAASQMHAAVANAVAELLKLLAQKQSTSINTSA
jgi:hypothetical protein